MDLGFLVSNDGIHFREPVADQVFIPRGRDNEWDRHGLLHGQGFEQVGDKTYIYYSNFDLAADKLMPIGIGLAVFARDRFAYLSTRHGGDGWFTSQPWPNSGPFRLRLNVDGLSADAHLRCELIDRSGKPVPGYAGDDAAVIRQSSLRGAVQWRSGEIIRIPNRELRLQMTLAGERVSTIKFYAAYLEPVSPAD
jgi:hypothetical protein